MKILVATTDEAALGAPLGRLRMVFAARLELEVVSGALYALSWLERRSADLIVSSETLEDMSGHELFDLVCDDDALRQVPFILLSDTGGDLVLPDHHLILGAHAGPTEILAEALSLLLMTGKLAEPAPDPLRRSYERDYSSGAVKLSGTLEALTLFDLAVSLGQGKRTGRLVVQIGDAEGTLYLSGGRLHHATFLERAGEDALQLIFAAVHHAPQTPFLFVGGESGHAPTTAPTTLPTTIPTTIRTSLDKLLLQIAVNLDEQAEQVPA